MLKSFLIVFLLSYGCVAVQGQQSPENDPKTLASLIQKNKPDTIDVGKLLELSNYYFLNKIEKEKGLDSAIMFAKRAETISLQLKNQKGLGNSYIALSRLLKKTQPPDKGKEYINKAIVIFTDAKLFTDLGFAFWELSGYYDLSTVEFPVKISLIEKSINSFHQAGNVKKEADALKELADVLQINGDYIQSLSKIKKALELYQSINEPLLHGTYDLLGDVSRSVGNLADAVKYGLLAVKTAEIVKDTSLQLCTIYNHLGISYYNLNDLQSSSLYYEKALSIAKKYNSRNDIYWISFNYGNNLIKMNKPGECIRHLTDILQKYPGIDTALLINYTISFIISYSNLKLFAKAEQNFYKLNSIIKKRQLTVETQRRVYLSSIKYLLASGQNSKARSYLEAADKFAVGNHNLTHLATNQLSWVKLDSALGDYKSTFIHFKKYIVLKDSILNLEKAKNISQLSIQYETEKKDNDIKLYEKESKLQQGKLTQERQTRNWILGGVVLLLIILGLLINNSRLKQQTNKKLKNQQNEIQEQNISLHQLVKEKEWLVKEIHHRVKNNFHIVMGLLGTQSEYLKSQEAILAMAESQHRIHAMSLIHQKLYQSDNLSAINMAEYIHELVNYLVDSFNIRKSIQFKLEIEPVELGLSYSVPLGLIMNEAITNSIKYAFPDNKEGVIYITFKHVSEYHVLLTIHDNGVGLPPGFNTQNPVSMGMKLMQGLNEDIDGKFSINNHDGTEIRLDFNYDPEINAEITQTQPVPPNSI